MPSSYPGSLDSLSNPSPTDAMDSGSGHAAQHADANNAIEAIQATLGTDPQGGEATVDARIAALEGSTGGGLVKVDSGTFSSSSNQNFDGKFTSTYDDYRLVVVGLAASGTDIGFRLRASSSDITSGYTSVRTLAGFVTTEQDDYLGTDEWFAGSMQPDWCSFVMDIYGPVNAHPTTFDGRNTGYITASGFLTMVTGGHEAGTAARDGFSLRLGGVVVTARWTLFGYSK